MTVTSTSTREACLSGFDGSNAEVLRKKKGPEALLNESKKGCLKNWKNDFWLNRITKLYASIKNIERDITTCERQKNLEVKPKRTCWLAAKFNNSAGKLISCFLGKNALLKHEVNILHPVVT